MKKSIFLLLLPVLIFSGCEDNSRVQIDNTRMEIKNAISNRVVLLKLKILPRIITLNKDTMNFYAGAQEGISMLTDIIEHDTSLNNEFNDAIKSNLK